MTRREWKRWAWAVVAGAAVAGGPARAADKPAGQTPDKPVSEWKAGDTVPWRVDGQQDKKVTVVKVTKKPDGGREVELKDPKTGDTFTLNEGPAAAKPADAPPVPLPAAPAPADKPAAKDAGLPKAKPRADGPPVVAEAEKPADKSAEASKPAESGKRTGPIRRLFGRMKGGPVSAETPPPAPVAPPAATPAAPPAATPAPAPLPPKPVGRPAGKPAGDVPNAMPAKPVGPPAGVPLPSLPVPLPPGGGMSRTGPPAGGVQPAGFASPAAVRTEEVRPYARLLQEAVAPSTRLVAAKALSQCRHASSDEVKGLLFAAAQADPCPSVRADCIGYLADLGYFTPAFGELVKAAAADPSDEVKAAARHATGKMTPR